MLPFSITALNMLPCAIQSVVHCQLLQLNAGQKSTLHYVINLHRPSFLALKLAFQ